LASPEACQPEIRGWPQGAKTTVVGYEGPSLNRSSFCPDSSSALPLSRTGPLARLALTGILLLASFLYLRVLGEAPVYLGQDEAPFALEGQSIAATGRDTTGKPLQLFIHISDPLTGEPTTTWYQPLFSYLVAAVIHFVPLSEWAVRLPIACLAILNVFLIYAVARRLFFSAWYAVLAAAILTLNPAHFILARQATDYFCPLPFALAWVWCLLLCLQTTTAWMPAATGVLLGVGLYSHISAWIVMPFYLAITCVVLWLSGKPLRAGIALSAGFAVALLPLIPWLWFHPGMPREVFGDYRVSKSFRLAERVALYWDYFNPSYLFLAGGADPTWSTGRVGVFLLAAAVLLPCGILNIWRRTFTLAGAAVLVAFFFVPAPIVAALIPASKDATARALLAVPFGVLISVAGMQWLIVERGRMGRIVAILLLLSMPVQFIVFARDYFTGYQVRAAHRFDYLNVRGVAEYVIASDESARVPVVYLSEGLGILKTQQWKFHLLTHKRPDLWERSKYFEPAQVASNDIPSGSLLVVGAGDNQRLEAAVGSGRWSVVHTVNLIDGEPAASLLRRD
jgi:4-amino-4-deoxy-L-arabinose transferase-like glycosyltransferase